MCSILVVFVRAVLLSLYLCATYHAILCNSVLVCQPNHLELNQKRFYKRETNSAAFFSYTKCLSIPLPFYVSKIINPFLNSIISTNHGKQEKFQPMLIVSLVQNLFCSTIIVLVESLTSYIEVNENCFFLSWYHIAPQMQFEATESTWGLTYVIGRS